MNLLQIMCPHPMKMAHVEKDETIKKQSNLFEHITYHLICGICNKKIDIKYAKTLDDFHNYKKEEVYE